MFLKRRHGNPPTPHPLRSALTHGLGITLLALFADTAQAAILINALLVKCTIESYGDTGGHFLKANNSQVDRDAAYLDATYFAKGEST
jgi:hypothetical protein